MKFKITILSDDDDLLMSEEALSSDNIIAKIGSFERSDAFKKISETENIKKFTYF